MCSSDLDIRYYGLMWALAILIGAKFFDNFEVCPAKWQPGAETLKPSLDLVGQL